MKKTLVYAIVTFAIAFGALFAYAVDLETFTAGEVIRAADVNANFEALRAAVDGTRSVSFPANALNFDPTSTVITAVPLGLSWQHSFAGPAFLAIQRPLDWDDTASVQLDLYFSPTTSAGGNIAFFIRPRSYEPGDALIDATSMDAPAAAAAGYRVFAKQTFTIPASVFDGELWIVSLQRDSTGADTYSDDVILHSVALTYEVVR
ncbi:MAG: hypothetical protein ROY82_00270 [Truepera sp.]|nr:hypothetical protein [Truepera sp.]